MTPYKLFNKRGSVLLELLGLAMTLILFFSTLTLLSKWFNEGKVLYEKVQGERRVLIRKGWQ